MPVKVVDQIEAQILVFDVKIPIMKGETVLLPFSFLFLANNNQIQPFLLLLV